MSSQKLLVIKHGALGDIIQGIDAYASLRAGYPQAHIAILTTPPFAALFAAMPWFDEVLTDHRAVLGNLRQMFRMRSIMRRGWDKVIDLQCSNRTATYQRFLAPHDLRWVGSAPGASDPLPDLTGVNNVNRMTMAAELAGGEVSTTASLDWLTQMKLPELLVSQGVVQDRLARALVLVPGCSPAKPSKRWPAESFAALSELAMGQGRDVVIVGTVADRDAGDAVLKDVPNCIDLIGQTDLAQLASLFAGCGGVIGNDTGPVFLAARSGTATLMVMGRDTNPQMSAPVGARAGWIRQDAISAVTPAAAFDALIRL